MELVIQISEVRLLEFGYYVLQISSENADQTNGSLQVDCSRSSVATGCGEASLKYHQNLPKAGVEFSITEDGNPAVAVAKGSSILHLENHHCSLFQGSGDAQSVVMTTPSGCQGLQNYFGTITINILKRTPSTANLQVPVTSLPTSVGSTQFSNTPMMMGNFNQILGNQQGQLLSSTLLADVHSTVEVCFHTIQGISQKFLVSLACLSATNRSQHIARVEKVSLTAKEQQSILSSLMLSHSVTHNTLEIHFADQHRGMILVSLSYPLRCFSPFVSFHLHVPLELVGGWGSLIFSACLRPPLQQYSGYVGIELEMFDLQAKEEFSQHTLVLYCLLGTDTFPSTLIPDKPPFSLISFDKISTANNGGQIVVIPSQPSSTYPIYCFFPIVNGGNSDTLHLLLYCVPQDQTKPWWKCPEFSSLSLNIANLKHSQPYRWHQSNNTDGSAHIKEFDFVVRHKTDGDEFLGARIDLNQLPLVSSTLGNEFPSTEAVQDVLPSHVPTDRAIDSSPNTKPRHRSVAEDDVYVHLIGEVKEYRAAIHRMGEDILGLRSENARLNEEVTRLQQIISSCETTLVLDATELEACSKLELIHKLSELYQKYTTLSASNASMKQEIQSLRNTCIQKNDLEKEHLKLQNAHTVQQKLLQKLQRKVEKYQRYSQTIQDREVIINKLEMLLEQQVHRQYGEGDAKLFLSEENARLRGQLRQLEEDLSEEVNKRKHDSQLVEQLEKLKSAGNVATTDSSVEEKLRRSEARVKALQEQLQLNAKEWGMQKTQFEIEITRLRTHIAALSPQSKSPMRQASHDSYPGFPTNVTKPVSL